MEFLEAEVTHFASKALKTLTLADLLHQAHSPIHVARLIETEIPKHFAARLRQIEEIDGWFQDDALADLHTRYTRSFQHVRMIDEIQGPQDLAHFSPVVERLKKRQREVLRLIGEALQRQDLGTKWVTRFLQSRIGTEMLTSQYLATVRQLEKGTEQITGIIDPTCEPAQICRNAVRCVRQLCLKHRGTAPLVDVQVRSTRSHSFSYIPIYLHYILVELLKNSCQATADASLLYPDALQEMAIRIVISSDDHRVAIRISDRGGGIPFDVGDRIWEFGFSHSRGESPTNMSGYGLGLPLARLYAGYLGGSLSIVSLPEYGTDAYLFLPRIDPEIHT